MVLQLRTVSIETFLIFEDEKVSQAVEAMIEVLGGVIFQVIGDISKESKLEIKSKFLEMKVRKLPQVFMKIERSFSH